MRCWLLSIGLACSFWSAIPAAAQELDLTLAEAPCAPEVTGTRRAIVTHEGAAGVWFERQVALCMLQRLEVLSLLVQRVRLLDQRLELSDERHALMERQVELSQRSERVATDALQTAERHARESREELNAWYRHPALWFTLGAVVVVGLEAAAVAIFYAVRP